MTTHAGSCHCGAVAFEVETDLETVIECNCTHCYRKGLMLTFVEPKAFRLTAGEGATTPYLFNRHAIEHQICPTCGVEAYAKGRAADGRVQIAVNVRCLTDVEPFSLTPTLRFDGLHKV